MTNPAAAAWLLAAAGCLIGEMAAAQSTPSPQATPNLPFISPLPEAKGSWWDQLGLLNLSGSLRGGYWTSDRVLDTRRNFAPGSIWLKTAPKFGDGFYADADGWIDREQPLNSSGQTKLRGELRDGYVGWRNETVSITAGRRIIPWGRADRINPTDVISSRDYTRLFVDDDDERRGSAVVTGSVAFGDYTATALWLPEFRPNIYPIPIVEGVTVRQGADRIVGNQYAVRLERVGSQIDWSVSYFDGLNRNPDARLSNLSSSSLGAPQITVEAVYNRVRVLGADVATNVGGTGVRGEIAYSEPTSSNGNLFNSRPLVQAVLGTDRNFGSLNLNLQYVAQYIFSYADPASGENVALTSLATRAALIVNQKSRVQHGPTLRVSYTSLNDTLTMEVAAAAFISDRSYLVRPRVSYALTDSVKITAGADIFNGPSESFFGQLHHNTTFLSEVRYGF